MRLITITVFVPNYTTGNLLAGSTLMDITEKQIKSKKRIGTLKGEPVVLLTTHGGFNVIAAKSEGKLKTLGTGPHPGFAKIIAKKNAPDIIMELSKSENDTVARNDVMLKKYERITDLVNAVSIKIDIE
jgi:hypothetical protein